MKRALLLAAGLLLAACAGERAPEGSAQASAAVAVVVSAGAASLEAPAPGAGAAAASASAAIGQPSIGEQLFAGTLAAQRSAALAVAWQIERGADAAQVMKSGSARIDGEWSFATRQMGALGLAQVMLAQPSLAAELRPALRRALREMIEPARLAFASAAWRGERGLDALAGEHGHAYLGYASLALCLAQAADPQLEQRALAGALSDALARRLDGAKHGVFETYPGETYPPDMALVLGGVALCDRVRGTDHRATLARAVAAMRRFVDPASGFLVQRVDAHSGAARDVARGSGTALAAYALAFADAGLAAELTLALGKSGDAVILGLAGVREYGPGVDGDGDADSGPLLLGISPSATAFAIGSARIERQRDRFLALVRSAEAFGAPELRDGRRFYAAGGALADAILLAMMTAGPMTARACDEGAFPCPAPAPTPAPP